MSRQEARTPYPFHLQNPRAMPYARTPRKQPTPTAMQRLAAVLLCLFR